MSEIYLENSANSNTYTTNAISARQIRLETEQTRLFRENFNFFGVFSLAYAFLYAFCMYRNSSGVAFPFFIAGSLLFICFTLNKLGISLKKGSIFYMVSIMMLGVSTFCTDDSRIIFFNKTGIFLLVMTFLLRQYFETSGWELGKFILSILTLVFMSIGELPRPFIDLNNYLKKGDKKFIRKIMYALLGLAITIPIFLVMLLLLSSADVVFREYTSKILADFSFVNIVNIVFKITFMYFASYMLTSFLCKHTIKEESVDRRRGEPIIAIIVTGMLSLLYLLFSIIQILYLFIGKMQLPQEYTYAEYAREGFFQLLAVSIINLIIVLFTMKFFRENIILKVILTVMSLCTFIMIVSSAMRMTIYIQYYYLTFLRILVLWSLAVLFSLFAGVILSIFIKNFRLFTYGMTVVVVFYLLLSFSRPDYIIAKVNLQNAASNETAAVNGFFRTPEPYSDYLYISELSCDAASVVIPYMRSLGYDMSIFSDAIENETNLKKTLKELEADNTAYDKMIYRFGFYYIENMREELSGLNLRTFNISRYMAYRQITRTVQN